MTRAAPDAVPEVDGNRVDPELAAALRRTVAARLARLDPPPVPGQRGAVVADQIAAVLDEHARALIDAGRPPLPRAAEAVLARLLRDAMTGLGGLQPLLDDDRIENISVNGCDRVFVRYAGGRRIRLDPVAASDAELVDLVRTIAARAGVEERRFDRGCPRLSVRLPDGHRLFAVMAVTDRPCVTIRRHRLLDADLGDLAGLGTLPPGLAAVLQAAVRAHRNLMVSGGTDTGKTTLARALAHAIDPDERLVVVEDVRELALDEDEQRHPDVICMQVREPNIEGQGGVDAAELVRWGLRMSPDRVFVGEVRGPEVVPMLNALSQGNDGSVCTVHASSSQQAFSRLATYAIQAPERLAFEATYALIAGAVHFVVHLEKLPGGARVVSSVREVTGFDGDQVVSNEVYRPGPGRRAVPASPIRASTMDDLVAAGLDPAILDADRWRP